MAERQTVSHANAQLAAWASGYANGVLEIYEGTQPASAALTEVGYTLLAIITESGGAFEGGVATNGLNFGTPTSGVLDKDSGETWTGLVLATGIAGWFRFYDNSYTKGAVATTGTGTTGKRFDGTCSTSSTAELTIPVVSLVAGAPITVNSLPITQPIT